VLWETKLLFEETCPVTLSSAFLAGLKDNHNFADQYDTQVVGSKDLADLATLFFSYGQQFQYDPHKSALWIKPDLFKMWIKTALGHASLRCPACQSVAPHHSLLVRQARIHPLPH
jgi:hypothetical protein